MNEVLDENFDGFCHQVVTIGAHPASTVEGTRKVQQRVPDHPRTQNTS